LTSTAIYSGNDAYLWLLRGRAQPRPATIRYTKDAIVAKRSSPPNISVL
jgi:hypothetical protein